MAYYSRIEQETLYRYDPITGYWHVDSTYPPHIRKLLDYANITGREYDEDGRVIAVKGFLNTNQIRLFKPRL